jgi:diguanylate cyclase (GGDEF)-like protein/PAS domain S-box-containing protein
MFGQCKDLWDTVQKGQVWQGEIKNKKKDGSDYWVETSVVPFLNQQGIPYQYVSIQTDVTSTRESESLLRKQYALANTITGLQESFITNADTLLFESMLTDFKILTQSCCGFLGDVRVTGDKAWIKIKASKNVDWSGIAGESMEIHEFNPLFKVVVADEQLVIANEIKDHPYGDYFPSLTEPLENFIMLPFLRGNQTVGVVGLANRKLGFNSDIVDFLEPLTVTCSNIIEAYKNVERRDHAEKALKVANEELEIRVEDRTRELVESNRRLEESKSRITAIMENVADGVITFDEHAIIESFNRAAEQIFGYDAAEAIGRNIAFLTSGHNVSRVEQSIWRNNTDDAQGEEVTAIRKDGGRFPLEISVRQITLDNRDLSIAIVRDITERKAMIEHLQHLADHDTLTGLFNRNYFRQELDRLVERIKRSEESQSALFYIDLDNFKTVNDTLGHAAGDNVLKDVASILRQRTRKSDLLCRLGGDEFTVIIYNANEKQATQIAESFRKEMESYAYEEGKQKIDVGCSIGVAMITQQSKTAEILLAHADYACHQAKKAGRNCVRVFNETDAATISSLCTDIGWSHKIKQAVENNNFVFHYQPIVNTETQQVDTYEVLIRMLDDNGQLIMPGGFLPAAERFSLAPSIDLWVIEHAIEELSIRRKENPRLRFTVNLSSQSLSSDTLVESINMALNRFGVDPQCLMFEITETAVIEDLAAAENCIQGIKKLGCKIALDDFGSGFASFACLQQLSIDVLKLDGRFIRNLNKNHADLKVVKAMCEMGHALDLLVIAEFVENEQVFNLLQNIGVDYAQGYYLGRPVGEIPTKISQKNIA